MTMYCSSAFSPGAVSHSIENLCGVGWLKINATSHPNVAGGMRGTNTLTKVWIEFVTSGSIIVKLVFTPSGFHPRALPAGSSNKVTLFIKLSAGRGVNDHSHP